MTAHAGAQNLAALGEEPTIAAVSARATRRWNRAVTSIRASVRLFRLPHSISTRDSH
jgi:hypothetical protein